MRLALRWLAVALTALMLFPNSMAARSATSSHLTASQRALQTTKPAGATKQPADATKQPAHATKKPAHATKKPAHATKKPEPSRTLGTFDISSAKQMAHWKAVGGTAVVVPVEWGRAQPAASGPVALRNAGANGGSVLSEIRNAHKAGLGVYLELGLQYPPAWVLSGVPEFVDQYGNSWSSAVASRTVTAANVRDWIWSAAGRQDVASFVSGALSDLAPVLRDVTAIRAGGGVDGELDFPPVDRADTRNPSYNALLPESYWGYDAAAKFGIGLATGETASPLPGYVYGSGTAAQNTEWANWYLGSLAEWIKWYVELFRSDGWSGRIYVLHPSFGMRSNFPPLSASYEQQLAFGTDPAVMMNAYDKIRDVYPWCTWADDPEPYYHRGDKIPSDMAAWRYLLLLARQRGLAAHIMGENTGGGGKPAIHRLMSGALAAGYTGVFYLDYPTLTAHGQLRYLTQQFKDYRPK